MVLYARNDIQSVSVPQGVGGCGNEHKRPAKSDGSPVPIWGIDCPGCENHLNNDVHWSRSRYRIPLTPDEEQEAQEAKELAQAAMQQQQIQVARQMAEAALVARGAVPEIDPADIAVTGSEAVPGSPEAAGGQRDRGALVESAKANYAALGKQELKELARDRGLVLSGTKEDLVARHAEHEVDNQ